MKINENQMEASCQIDFCFTNLAKVQTKSVIHNRILLDVDHFISDKGFYYEKFKEDEFIPTFIKIKNTDIPDLIINDFIILKPDTGASSKGIQIFSNYSQKNITNHVANFNEFKNWTISKLYTSKLWNNEYIVSARIYFLVRKIKTGNNICISGYWYDEFIHYRSLQKYKPVSESTKNQDFIEIYVSNYDSGLDPIDFFKKRVVFHKEYMTMFKKSEYDVIINKIGKYLKTITEQIAKHATCSNDYSVNYDDIDNKNMTFHLYGVDAIITDNLDIKFVEINGAPSITNCCENKINYNVLINQILKLTVDVLFDPQNDVKYDESMGGGTIYGKFKNSDVDVKFFDRKFIKCGEFTKILKTPVYFARQIYEKYPFIVNAFFNDKRNKIYQRVKNPHIDNIYLFYGLRDLYIRKKSSSHYYDEILEWKKCKNTK